MKTERTLAHGQCAESLFDGASNHVDVFRELDGSIGETAINARNRFLMIIDLEFGELQPMSRRDDDHPVLEG